MAMSLGKRELESIGRYVKSQLPGWIRETEYSHETNQLTERMIRVEEELKTQRELMQQGFHTMDKRFETLQVNMDKRFEAMQLNIDKRFETIQSSTDKRFEAMQHHMEKRFEAMQHHMDKRFETTQHHMDKRFETMQGSTDKRFEAADSRFESMQHTMDKRFNLLQWFIGIGFTLIVVLMSVYEFVR